MNSDLGESQFSDAALNSEGESSSPNTSSGAASPLLLEHSDDSGGELSAESRNVAPYSFEPSDLESDDASASPSATSDNDAEDDRLADLSW